MGNLQFGHTTSEHRRIRHRKSASGESRKSPSIGTQRSFSPVKLTNESVIKLKKLSPTKIVELPSSAQSPRPPKTVKVTDDAMLIENQMIITENTPK